jgi:UDP-N-acetylmuramoylalanine--D-glutamate ligase
MTQGLKNMRGDKSVLVIGLGKSGQSSCRFLLSKGYQVWAVDDNIEQALASFDETLKHDRRITFFSLQEALLFVRRAQPLVIISPGVRPEHSLVVAAKELGCEVVGEIELALRCLASKGPTMVAITGTNGKTTTTSLITHILNFAGIPAKACGNIGSPLIDEAQKEVHNEVLVVELSSFQLETAKTKIFNAGVLLNITPDHLDRHKTMLEYAKAKLHLTSCIKDGGTFFLHESCKDLSFMPKVPENACYYGLSQSCFAHIEQNHILFNNRKEAVLPDKLFDKQSHDVDNFLAACCIARALGVQTKNCSQAYATFKKAPHTLEHVTTINGISFIDDSKGTNLDAVIRAVQSVPGRIFLIAGGVHKGESYHRWIDVFKERVQHVFAIGASSELIQKDIGHTCPVTICSSLQEAVLAASKSAKPQDTVMLSPGCSSFDMFKDYKERGQKFQEIVQSLA